MKIDTVTLKKQVILHLPYLLFLLVSLTQISIQVTGSSIFTPLRGCLNRMEVTT